MPTKPAKTEVELHLHLHMALFEPTLDAIEVSFIEVISLILNNYRIDSEL